MKTSMTKLIFAAAACTRAKGVGLPEVAKRLSRTAVAVGCTTLFCLGAMAEIANTVKVTKFHQSYPYLGKATVEYTVDGTLPANAVAEIVLNTDDMSATFVQYNIVTGVNSHVIDFASSFDGALVLSNASYVVTLSCEGALSEPSALGGVQLWEGGPYWAECNVGANSPEEYGWYFWWGDTVGYKRENNAWIAVDGSISNFSFESGNTPTYGKSNAVLQSEGYIDSAGNLVAAYDAATAHLGSLWRMPTSAEFAALVSNCTTVWTAVNGVYGRLVTGKGDYANRSIFLPASGLGLSSYLRYGPGSDGYYWSSTPNSDNANDSWDISFYSTLFRRGHGSRYGGRSVRPVIEFVQYGTAVGSVTYDLPSVTETQTTPVPVPHTWIDDYPALLAGQSGDYEAAANATAANGRMVWACYMLGLDPVNNDATNDFRITLFPMNAYGTPDLENILFYPPRTRWNVQGAVPVLKGAASLDAETWPKVTDENKSLFRFFKVEVELP